MHIFIYMTEAYMAHAQLHTVCCIRHSQPGYIRSFNFASVDSEVCNVCAGLPYKTLVVSQGLTALKWLFETTACP